jgi:hypothetical protein
LLLNGHSLHCHPTTGWNTPASIARSTSAVSLNSLTFAARSRVVQKNWAAKECVCHLRDTEELFKARFDLIVAEDNPALSFDPATPDRWAEERQYLRHDVQQALAHFRRRREESLTFLGTLTLEQWKRGGTHATRRRITIDDFVTVMAGHDDNHLAQLKRALDGRA